MPTLALTILPMLAALGSAAAGTVYAVFSLRIMPRLRTGPAADSIARMQELNARALQAPFVLVFFGAAALCVAVVVAALLRADPPALPLLLIGAGAHLLGWVLTIVWNVPLNRALDRVRPGGPGAERAWARFHGQWTPANTLRGALSWAGAGFLLAGALT